MAGIRPYVYSQLSSQPAIAFMANPEHAGFHLVTRPAGGIGYPFAPLGAVVAKNLPARAAVMTAHKQSELGMTAQTMVG